MTARRCILPPPPAGCDVDALEPADSVRPTCTDLPPPGCSDADDDIDAEHCNTVVCLDGPPSIEDWADEPDNLDDSIAGANAWAPEART